MSTHPLSKSREICERWVIEGNLVLQTPTHLGNGDTDGIVDMPLLLDEATGKALLPGTSLAGALRNYLQEYRHGFGKRQSDNLIEALFGGDKGDDKGSQSALIIDEALFGGDKGDDKGSQSALIIDDALGEAPRIELRDGVRIDSVTRTAKIDFRNGKARGYKYDLQLLEAGATFSLRMELLISAGAKQQELKQVLALALNGLAAGEIAIGLRKRRGFGECRVTNWRVQRYDLQQATDLVAWLAADRPGWNGAPSRPTQAGKKIEELLGVSLEGLGDGRSLCSIQAKFVLDSSLLIRAGFGEQDRGPDTVHLHSARPGGQRKPVLSGTSLAGALRHRAERILRTQSNGARSAAMIDNMFGPAEITGGKQKAKASRLLVKETVIDNPVDLVQNRICIDRFTGSVYGTGLFNEQPVFGKDDTCVAVELILRNPTKREIGLLLLLLKDLWTSDLPLGGEASIGRGRLRGVTAEIKISQEKATPLTINIDQKGDRLMISDRDALERYVAALQPEVIQ